jgi:UDP-N-acetylmuramoyl-tripeptide--D-alanyl-D-alanine ligase
MVGSMFPVEKIAQIVGGELLRRESVSPTRAIHDSRLVEQGDLFVALSGLRSNGHTFLAEAFDRGASAAIVSSTSNLPSNARNLILVANPALALQQWAAAWRDTLNATLVAITGTNGKTTVRALLHHLLSAQRTVYSSPHNYNTEIGLPIALLSMPPSAELGIFELGAEQPGDIALLARILRPHLGIITSVGPGHLDKFETVAAVASEKWSLVNQLPENGEVIINADVPIFLNLAAAAKASVVTVGLNHGDVRGHLLQAVPNVKIALDAPAVTLTTSLAGAHNAQNLLLASVAAHRLEMSWPEIADQATTFRPIPHRLDPIHVPFGTVLDDAYNANPASMKAALNVLSTFGEDNAVRVFVFGEMLGLGSDSESFHRTIAQLALSLPIHAILPIGNAALAACRTVADASAIAVGSENPKVVILPRPEIADWIKNRTAPLVVLVKGSRALALEGLVDELKNS